MTPLTEQEMEQARALEAARSSASSRVQVVRPVVVPSFVPKPQQNEPDPGRAPDDPALGWRLRIEQHLRHARVPELHLQKRVPSGCSKWVGAYKLLDSRVASGGVWVLLGGRGCGKTQLAVEVMRRVAQNHDPQPTMLYSTAAGFTSDLLDAESKRVVRSKYEGVRILVMDALQNRDTSNQWSARELTALVDARYAAMRFTILLSNETPESFTAAAGVDIVSRMNETGGLIRCDGWKVYR